MQLVRTKSKSRVPTKGKRIVKRRTIIASPKLSVLSLFSGCGGLDLGFKGGFKYRQYNFPVTGFKISLANDIDPAAEKVYSANKKFFGDHDFCRKDVRELSINEIPEFNFLIAGFPCQPFSNAGNRKGINDERGTLFEECERFLKEGIKRRKPPIGFVFENVKGIVSSKMSDGTSIPDEIVKRCERLGYNTNYCIVKASDYGVPTNRQRLIIVGLRKKYGYFDFHTLKEIVQTYDLPSELTNPYELTLGAILSDIPKHATHQNDYWKFSPGGQFMVDKIGPCPDGPETLLKFKKKIPLEAISTSIFKGRSWKNMNPKDYNDRFRKIFENPKKYRAPNFYRRFNLGEINGTIIASAQPENCGITHPFLNRRFTIREIARIQSFPDDFTFPFSTIANAYKVIGNAVPPVLGWVIAKGIQKHLKKFT
jgi:DNA (cytosine-5)-methyltransferase 1